MAIQDRDVRDQPFRTRAEAAAATVAEQVSSLFPGSDAGAFESAQNNAYDAARALLEQSRDTFMEALDDRSIKPVRAVLLVFVGWAFAVASLALGGAFVLLAQRL